jgi:Tol biopolymer transport system component
MRKEALSVAWTALAIMLAAVAAVAAVTVFVGARPAEAAFPGINGKIASMSDRDGDYEIYSVSHSGSGRQQFTDNSVFDAYPAWSRADERWLS